VKNSHVNFALLPAWNWAYEDERLVIIFTIQSKSLCQSYLLATVVIAQSHSTEENGPTHHYPRPYSTIFGEEHSPIKSPFSTRGPHCILLMRSVSINITYL
jgi:hypothetical protein